MPTSWYFSAIMGFSGGFVSMVGNAAAPLMALYFLSMRLPKYSYIGTTAWFFFIVNLTKVPLHIYVWKTITIKTFLLGVVQIPVVAFGAYLGIQVVKVFSEKFFRFFMIISTLLSATILIKQ